MGKMQMEENVVLPKNKTTERLRLSVDQEKILRVLLTVEGIPIETGLSYASGKGASRCLKKYR